MRFIHNAWYVAAWSAELGPRLLAKTLLNQPLVLFRRRDGTVAALEDLCPHRFLPLSMGELIDDHIQCGYHGLKFDAGGHCVRVPGQDRIPRNAYVRSYPVSEQMGLVWVWMGAPEQARQHPVFDLPQYHDPRWGVAYGDTLRVQANYLAVAENLCDPAHVSFVHKTTLGSAAGEEIPIRSERRGNTIVTSRWTLDSPPVGFFQLFGHFSGNVDRWQYYYLHAPATAIIDFGSAVAGSGAVQGDRSRGIQVYSCHFLSPETAATTLDYWLHVRNFAITDTAVSERISEQFRIAFAEDKIILEAVQQRQERYPDRPMVKIAIDSGASRLQRLTQELLAQEEELLP